jgi:hypothetical protein
MVVMGLMTVELPTSPANFSAIEFRSANTQSDESLALVRAAAVRKPREPADLLTAVRV